MDVIQSLTRVGFTVFSWIFLKIKQGPKFPVSSTGYTTNSDRLNFELNSQTAVLKMSKYFLSLPHWCTNIKQPRRHQVDNSHREDKREVLSRPWPPSLTVSWRRSATNMNTEEESKVSVQLRVSWTTSVTVSSTQLKNPSRPKIQHVVA